MTTFANIDDYVTDPGLEQDGIRLGFGKNRFIDIRRAGGTNVEYDNYVANRAKQCMVDGEIDNDIAKEEFIKAYAKKVVTGWSGWLDDKGNEIEFSADKCIELFNASPEIYEKVKVNANNLDNFRRQEVKDSGNV